MKRLTKVLVIVGIIGIVSAILISKCSRDRIPIGRKTIDSTSFYKGQISQIQAQGEAKLKRWRNDSLSMESEKQRYVKQITVVTKQRDRARQIAQHFIDSIPEVKQFVMLDDSVDQINLDRIQDLELDKIKITTSFFDILHSKDEEIKVSKELTVHLESTISELTRDLKKMGLKRTFWKWVAIITAAGLVGKSLGLF